MSVSRPPSRYLDPAPDKYTVVLHGYSLNLVKIATKLAVDHGYLSRVLAGKRTPSIPYAEAIADALGWSLQELLSGIRSRASES